MFRDLLLAVLSVPLTDPGVGRLLNERDVAGSRQLFLEWLESVQRLKSRVRFRILENAGSGSGKGSLIHLEFSKPYAGKANFRIVLEDELCAKSDELVEHILSEEVPTEPSAVNTVTVFLLCGDDSKEATMAAIESFRLAVSGWSRRVIVMEPAWVASILIEQMKPMLLMGSDRQSDDARTSYFDSKPKSDSVDVRRVAGKLEMLLGAVIDDPGNYHERLRRIEREQPFDGTILLCTTFLPPVTHSWRAIERFYRSAGTPPQTLELIRQKHLWELEQWETHVRSYQRIDILDRALIEEYLASPEYYQMLLNHEEIEEQLDKVVELLQHENYSICLTPEAVDIPYEVRGPEVRIRTDRRNKGQPRAGRISGLVLHDHRLAEMFEREFWSMFRLSEPEFKDKTHIAGWLKSSVSRHAAMNPVTSRSRTGYDVFLCHNSADKPVVREIAKQLYEHGVVPWFDEWNLIPGRPWQRVLESQIQEIEAAAVFVGEGGPAPWMHFELDAFLREFANRGCPVIPVILPTAQDLPDIPIFLRGFHWVDFRNNVPDPMEQLVWGITGKRADGRKQ